MGDYCGGLASAGVFHGGAAEFAVGFAFFDVVAFVELGFAFADSEEDFYAAVLPVEGEGDDGVGFGGGVFGEFANLGLVEEEFTDGFGLVVLAVAEGVLVNVGVVEEDLALVHAGKSVADLTAAGAEGLDLGAVEDDAGLVSGEDVVVAAGLGVVEDVAHKRKPARRRASWLAQVGGGDA